MNNNITMVNDQDAADILGVSKGTLQVWRSTGSLQHSRTSDTGKMSNYHLLIDEVKLGFPGR